MHVKNNIMSSDLRCLSHGSMVFEILNFWVTLFKNPDTHCDKRMYYT